MTMKSLDLSVDLICEKSSYLFGRRSGETGYDYHHHDDDRRTAQCRGGEREKRVYRGHESPEQRLRESDQQPCEHAGDHPVFIRPAPPDPEQKRGENGVSGKRKGNRSDLGYETGWIQRPRKDQDGKNKGSSLGDRHSPRLTRTGIDYPVIDVVRDRCSTGHEKSCHRKECGAHRPCGKHADKP